MKTNLFSVIGILAAILLAGNAFGMCGMGGGGGHGGGYTTGSGGGSGHAVVVQPPTKVDLPAEVTVADLDTSHFDSMAYDLGLSDKQQNKISELKTQIKETCDKLKKYQADARSGYKKAAMKDDITDATNKVLAAISACKSYDAAKVFESSVNSILNAAQASMYKHGVKTPPVSKAQVAVNNDNAKAPVAANNDKE